MVCPLSHCCNRNDQKRYKYDDSFHRFYSLGCCKDKEKEDKKQAIWFTKSSQDYTEQILPDFIERYFLFIQLSIVLKTTSIEMFNFSRSKV